MFTVKTVSGFEMILEDAGVDGHGNQLWRQVKITLGRPKDWLSQYDDWTDEALREAE